MSCGGETTVFSRPGFTTWCGLVQMLQGQQCPTFIVRRLCAWYGSERQPYTVSFNPQTNPLRMGRLTDEDAEA